MRHSTIHIATGLLLVSLLALAACSQLTDPTADDPNLLADKRGRLARAVDPVWLGSAPPAADLPATPDEAVERFLSAHDSRNTALLGQTLHQDYLFVRENGEVWSRPVDLSILAKMMNGKAGQGGVVITSMTTEAFEPFGAWNNVTSSDPFFSDHVDAVSRVYDVRFVYEAAGQSADWLVEGMVIAYAVPVGDAYQLLGLLDMTYGSKTSEAVSWSQVKTLFE